MEILLYLAMGVFALLFAVVLYYLITWTVRRASGSPRSASRAATTADSQPDDASARASGTPTTRRRS